MLPIKKVYLCVCVCVCVRARVCVTEKSVTQTYVFCSFFLTEHTHIYWFEVLYVIETENLLIHLYILFA